MKTRARTNRNGGPLAPAIFDELRLTCSGPGAATQPEPPVIERVNRRLPTLVVTEVPPIDVPPPVPPPPPPLTPPPLAAVTRLKSTTALLSVEATYTLLPSELTATELAPSRPSAPMQLGGPYPELPTQPIGFSPPPGTRSNSTAALLTPEATYTFLPSGLTATDSGPSTPSAPMQLGGPVPELPTQPIGFSPPPGRRSNSTSALLEYEATYTFLPSGLTATEVAPSRPSAPMQPAGPSPELPTQPIGFSPPPGTRSNSTTALLTAEATYTFLPSGLTATEGGPSRPAAPMQLGGPAAELPTPP